MYDDWTKCTECQFFDPEKYYCKRMLHTVTIGCPCGEPKPLTNYDRIVSKTPEEMAEWLVLVEQRILEMQPALERPALYKDWIDFLKQEAEA